MRITLLIMLIIVSIVANAQFIDGTSNGICSTKSLSSSSYMSNSDLHSPQLNDFLDVYKIKIRIHRVRRGNGSGGIPVTQIVNLVNELNQNFQSDISFIWEGTIRDVNDDTIYNSDYTGYYNFDLFDNYSDQGYIDVFVFDKPLNGVFGVADGLADETRLIVGSDADFDKVVTHEIGHVLGLFHTFHGTIGGGIPNNYENSDGYGSHDPECTGSQGSWDTGDFVQDTLGDVGPEEDSGIQNCEFTSQYQNVLDYCDNTSSEQYFQADITNYMRRSDNAGFSLECWDHFTTGQYMRMKAFISNYDHLRVLLDESNAANCQAIGEEIVNSLVAVLTQCNTFQITVPEGINNAGSDYAIRARIGNTIGLVNFNGDGEHIFTVPFGTSQVTFLISYDSPLGKITCFQEEVNIMTVNCFSNIQVFPNPTEDYLNVIDDANFSMGRFDLYDMYGNKVNLKNIRLGNKIDVSSLSNGLYFLKFYDKLGNLIEVKKIKKV